MPIQANQGKSGMALSTRGGGSSALNAILWDSGVSCSAGLRGSAGRGASREDFTRSQLARSREWGGNRAAPHRQRAYKALLVLLQWAALFTAVCFLCVFGPRFVYYVRTGRRKAQLSGRLFRGAASADLSCGQGVVAASAAGVSSAFS